MSVLSSALLGGDDGSAQLTSTRPPFYASVHAQLPSVFCFFVVVCICAVVLMPGNWSQKELGKGPGVVDLHRCWGFPEQSYKGRI